MKFSRLQLTNFTVFEDTTFEFCPGINVLIGANGTGKSHVLKAAYTIQKTWDDAARQSVDRQFEPISKGFKNLAWKAVEDIFRVDSQELIRVVKPVGVMPAPKVISASAAEVSVLTADDHLKAQEKLRLDEAMDFLLSSVRFEDGQCRVSLQGSDGRRSTIETDIPLPETSDCLYLPPREFLAPFEGFVAAYSRRELAFDRTYNDLCLALSALNLKAEAAKWGQQVIAKLESELSGPVELRDGRFYVGERPAAVVAEGHRKFAMLIQLLRNGGISSGATLYWDEPESGLNPKLVKVIADVLLLLAEQGVQIVIATHDYLLTQELSLAAEYRTLNVPIKFFCLNREVATEPVSVEVGETLADLPQNPIVEEFSALYDREQALFYRAHPASGGA